MFKKNSMGFFIGLDYYLYYSYSSCTTISLQSHVLPECSMITWPCHMIWLPKFPCCLYLNLFVWLSAWMCQNLFSFGALITIIECKEWNSIFVTIMIYLPKPSKQLIYDFSYVLIHTIFFRSIFVDTCHKLHLDHNSGNTWPISMI